MLPATYGPSATIDDLVDWLDEGGGDDLDRWDKDPLDLTEEDYAQALSAVQAQEPQCVLSLAPVSLDDDEADENGEDYGSDEEDDSDDEEASSPILFKGRDIVLANEDDYDQDLDSDYELDPNLDADCDIDNGDDIGNSNDSTPAAYESPKSPSPKLASRFATGGRLWSNLSQLQVLHVAWHAWSSFKPSKATISLRLLTT
ncbi:hypothetical protein BC939DRAFT_481710 [Gamsiella multidivaricata]|uniref:uncharacterized protein n=1 Tax=Gamsiella multidivaricata TaxID=101098 RepID=UPI0022211B33|nr:uncharacterized protein BC939DRAFT_481710 [Gamsiella multidivaricata]KAI7816798.1 hypothetical protein BC939DRAFT_481710 [Gamsiella multidivaricata]